MTKIPFSFFSFFIIYISIVSTCCQPQNSNWTHFRGSNLDGIAMVDHAPLRWTKDSNIIWKTEIHDRGWSSPAILRNSILIRTSKYLYRIGN